MTGGRRGAALAVAAAVLLVGGCSSQSGGSSRASSAAAGVQAPDSGQKAAAPAVGNSAKPGAGAPSAMPAVQPRLIAYSAQLTVRTKDVLGALDRARGLAGPNGFVSGDTVTGEKEGFGGPTSARIMLKVPSASFQQTVDQLSGLGTLLTRSTSADDVTQQVVDVDSRLKSQQASVDRVRKLMEEAKSLSDVVSLESELSRREADLESLQRQQQELGSRTSLSTIELRLEGEYVPPAAAPKEQHGFWGSIGHALAGGWHVLAAIVRGLLIGLAAAAPFLLVLGPLGWMAWYLRKRKQS